MKMIRPVSDLRNHFADISRTVHETAQPVFLTKNGYGDMVIMSMEIYESMMNQLAMYQNLELSERQVEEGKMKDARKSLAEMRTKYGL